MMKQPRIFSSLLLVLALLGCASGGGQDSSRPQGAAYELASMLTGTFEAEGQGVDLRLDVGSTDTLTGQRFNLVSTVTGKLGERDVREQGRFRLESRGSDVEVTYIPQFDPTMATELSPRDTGPAPTELAAACTFVLEPDGGAYVGETLGSGACIRAIDGAVGQWQLQVTPETIRLTNLDTQQSLLFRQTQG